MKVTDLETSGRKYVQVVWENKFKNALRVKYVDSHGNRTTTGNGIVQKFDNNDNITNIYNKILEQWTEEQIDKATEENERVEQEQFKAKEEQRKQEQEYQKVRKVFETKIEIFNIPEVSESTDKEAKAKIRRSKSSVEAIINTVLLILKERENAAETDQPEE